MGEVLRGDSHADDPKILDQDWLNGLDREYLRAILSSLSEKRKPNQMVDKIMEILSLQTCRLYAVHI